MEVNPRIVFGYYCTWFKTQLGVPDVLTEILVIFLNFSPVYCGIRKNESKPP